MRLLGLTIRRAPGLPDGLLLDGLGEGLNVVWGPNASGKSTAARILVGLLWPGAFPLDGVDAEARWQDGSDVWTARVWGSRVNWNPGTPPLPGPDVASLYLLGLPSLLAASGDDKTFARRISVELAGGYDVEAALKQFDPASPRRGKVHTDLQEATRKLRKLEGKSRSLSEQEAQLPGLERQREAARQAQALTAAAERAVKLARLRRELDHLQNELDALPPDLGRLTGREIERLDELEKERDEILAELEEIGRKLDASHRRYDALKFENDPPPAEEMAAWTAQAAGLEADARRLATLREQLAAAKARQAEAAAGLFSTPPEGPAFEPERLSGLRQRIARRREAADRASALEAEVQLWESLIEEMPEGQTAAGIGRGIEALREWLRTPEAGHHRGWMPWAFLGVGVAAAVLGALAGGPWWTVPGVLLGGVAAGWIAAGWRGSTSRERREELQATAAAVHLEPQEWSAAAVRARLVEAEDSREALRRNETLHHKAADARTRLATAREELDAASSAIREEAKAIGLDPELPDLPLLEAANRLQLWLTARDEVADLAGTIGELERRSAHELETLVGRLQAIGVTPPTSAAEAPAVINEIEKRMTALHTETAKLDELERNRTAARERLKRTQEAIASLWAGAGVEAGDRLELVRRLELRPRFEELTGDHKQALGRIEQLEGELAESWADLGLDPRNFTEAEAAACRKRLKAEADQLEPLSERIAGITERIEQARGATALEEARAAVAAAAQAIGAHRRKAVGAALARLVLEVARERVQATHAPAVFQRAQAWFGRFTRHAFRLELDRTGTTFAAIDASSRERRSLDELSDATRIHLLLAARLAAIEEAEGTLRPLPLLLDEALSTTDPGRFAEIAHALTGLADSGRQIVSLTADPAEIEAWKHACRANGAPPPNVIELAPARSADATPVLPAPSPPEIPAPEGDDPAVYARRLGVPTPDGFDPAGRWHVIFLLPDRLDAVHACLRAGLDRTGQLLDALDAGMPAVDEETARLVRARAALLDAVLAGWRTGRGRPLRWEDVVESGAVSSTYEAKVRKLAEEHAREPRVFLECVRKLKGFRSAKAEQLEAALLEAGVLDEAPPLPDDEIVVRAAASARTAWQRAELSPADAAAWARSILRMIGTASQR